MKRKLLVILTIIPFFCHGQNYTSYFTGNVTDIITNPSGGVCLMGGATEDENAMKWFLQRANGGDILVLRTRGSNGYNNYLYSGLGETVNSVETIVCNNALASSDPYIIKKIKQLTILFVAFNSRNINALKSHFTDNIEVYQDNIGLRNYDETIKSFT